MYRQMAEDGRRTSFGLIQFFVRAYPGRGALMIGALLLAGLMEGCGISLFLPLLELASRNAGPPSEFGRAVQNGFHAIGLEPGLKTLLAFIVGTMTLKGAFLWLAMSQVGYTIAHVAMRLRLALIGGLLQARWGYFAGQPAGHVANAIGDETRSASATYQGAAMLMAYAIQAAVYTAVALLVSWQTALMAVCAGMVVMGLMSRLVRLSRVAGNRQAVLMKSLTARLVDAVQGIKPIKAMARENLLLPMLESETEGLNHAQRLKVLAAEGLATSQEPLTVLIMAIGLYVVMTHFNQPFAELLVLAFLFSRLVNQINAAVRCYQVMLGGEGAFWSLRGAIARAEEARETATGTRVPGPLSRGIRLDGVEFAYTKTPVLTDVSFEIPAGRFVALTGPSGCGKTTIADLIAGLFLPRAGTVSVDGVPLVELDLAAWRRRIGYVPQEMLLFHDTVRHNVTLGDDAISDGAVVDALKQADAWSFVSALPEGLDTSIGERGSKLSGGQRQRLALARALVHAPDLLILDEVTTALDPASEAEVCDTLRKLGGTRTIIAVSHQPALVDAADMVYRVEHGTVRRERP